MGVFYRNKTEEFDINIILVLNQVSLVLLASRHVDLIVHGYTHLQTAQLVLLHIFSYHMMKTGILCSIPLLFHTALTMFFQYVDLPNFALLIIDFVTDVYTNPA